MMSDDTQDRSVPVNAYFKPFGRTAKARSLVGFVEVVLLIALFIYLPLIALIVVGWNAHAMWNEWKDLAKPETKTAVSNWAIRRFWRPIMRIMQ
jgi:hypothetical protein